MTNVTTDRLREDLLGIHRSGGRVMYGFSPADTGSMTREELLRNAEIIAQSIDHGRGLLVTSERSSLSEKIFIQWAPPLFPEKDEEEDTPLTDVYPDATVTITVRVPHTEPIQDAIDAVSSAMLNVLRPEEDDTSIQYEIEMEIPQSSKDNFTIVKIEARIDQLASNSRSV